jgi:carbamoyltransferase
VTVVLGLSAYYHDSAAALVVNGDIVAAAQEERFSRQKHDRAFPARALEFCLSRAGITARDIDYVAFYEKPLLKFDRVLDTFLATAPRSFQAFRTAMPLQVRERMLQSRDLKRHLPGFDRRIIYTQHHRSHAASAFFPSPFEEAAVLTLDGVGEWATASFGLGRGNQLTLLGEQKFPHSLGLLYSAFTYFCGFRVNSGEYKLMGLAPYGQPRFVDRILDNMVVVKADGSIWLDQTFFNYTTGLTMTSAKCDALFGGQPRRPESPITQREQDIAASIQLITEEIMLKSASHVHKVTGAKYLCLAGGVALNCVGNGRILRDGPFDDIWIQPAAGDAGGALGAALHVWYDLLKSPRVPAPEDAMQGGWLGPDYSEREIVTFLDDQQAVYTTFPDDESLCAAVAEYLANEQVVGWLHGRMEFGPRALGARSILGDARSTSLQRTLNLKIKFRESFRPFAPAVLRECAAEYFELDADQESPYMLVVAPVQPSRRLAPAGADAQGLDRVNTVRSDVPAVTHVDFSARVQTVDGKRHGRFHRLLEAFRARTGSPVLINTSFNVRGEPIVASPADAWRCFMATNMDVLVLERTVLLKAHQKDARQISADEALAGLSFD